MDNIFERIFNDQYSLYEDITKDCKPSPKKLQLEQAQDKAYEALTAGLKKIEQVDALQDAIYAANNLLMAKAFAAGARFGIQAAMEALREDKTPILTELVSKLEEEKIRRLRQEVRPSSFHAGCDGCYSARPRS